MVAGVEERGAVCVCVCVLPTVNPHSDGVISVLFFLFSSSPLFLSAHISQDVLIRLSGDRMQQLLVCLCVCGRADKDRGVVICPYGDKEGHKSRRLNNNKLALASCVGKPSNSKPLTSSVLWSYSEIQASK